MKKSLKFRGEDLSGKAFGRLTVCGFYGRSKSFRKLWKCQCSCGKETVVDGYSLKSKNTRSCGCLQTDTVRLIKTTHGKSVRNEGKFLSKSYSVWRSMKSRCLNLKDKSFKQYGGRGISICERWMDFNNFYKDMGEPPMGLSIHRVDNDGNYEPGNCIWADDFIQANNRTNSRKEAAFGKTKTVAEWARDFGISYDLLDWRAQRYGMEKALNMPTPSSKPNPHSRLRIYA